MDVLRAGASGYAPSPERHPLPVDLAGPTYLAVGDADSDGRNDVVVANDSIGSSVRLLLQRAEGGFAPAPVIDVVAGPLMFADMNRDGRADLVTLTIPPS